jgi:hypothetical protein
MKTILKIATLLGLFAAAALGQQNTLYNTTLSAAVTSSNQQTVCLTSVTNYVAPSATAAGSIIFVDREEMQGVGPAVGTCIPVLRGGPDGTPTQLHASGAWVWMGDPTWFSNKPAGQEQWGANCTASTLYASPIIYVKTGNWAVCDSTSHIAYAGPYGDGGFMPAAITNKTTGNYTALATDNLIVFTGLTGTSVVTLPAATALYGKVYTIKNGSSAADAIEIATVEGSSTYPCGIDTNGWQVCTVYSNGTAWFAKSPYALGQ